MNCLKIFFKDLLRRTSAHINYYLFLLIFPQKVRLLKNLMEQLGEDTNSFDVHYCMKSPLHKKVIQLRLADGSSRRSSGNCQHIMAP